MNKIQKIWLAIFVAMFIVPEILWSPIGNALYQLFQNSNHVKSLRDSFLNNPGSPYALVLFVQLVGIALTAFFLLYYRNQVKSKILFISLGILLLIVAIPVFYLFWITATFHGIG